MSNTVDPGVADAEPAQVKRFQTLWSQLFEDASVQVYFADNELNARVYTLDAESGYKVQHKKVGGGLPLNDEDSLDAQRLAFPKKARRGEAHGRAQLQREDVIAVRKWAAELAALSEIPRWSAKAQEMGISEGTLRDIVNRRTWKHVP